jgi:hypothetical protein
MLAKPDGAARRASLRLKSCLVDGYLCIEKDPMHPISHSLTPYQRFETLPADVVRYVG